MPRVTAERRQQTAAPMDQPPPRPNGSLEITPELAEQLANESLANVKNQWDEVQAKVGPYLNNPCWENVFSFVPKLAEAREALMTAIKSRDSAALNRTHTRLFSLANSSHHYFSSCYQCASSTAFLQTMAVDMSSGDSVRIAQDLLALKGEFLDAYVEPHGSVAAGVGMSGKTLTVVMPPVRLKDRARTTNLGRMRLHMALGNPRTIKASAVEPLTVASTGGHEGRFFHPHVKPGGAICMGDAADPYRQAVDRGEFFVALTVMRQMLMTYNSGSPYVYLEDWLNAYGAGHDAVGGAGVTMSPACVHCKTPVLRGSRTRCAGCQERVHAHDSCAVLCKACNTRVCRACQKGCCRHGTICPNCVRTCPKCNGDYCNVEGCHDSSLCRPQG